ncbi:hypothetical protein HU200_048985 [Digitaria exilis]|uniref:Myb-like domain-containing protein n=1 Tax=Digitaria exilis TaxID=1010633 RepID=A0A835ASC2_9POAL|nr:hypothetical protein HU200_048985 [Digitaria exilis]
MYPQHFNPFGVAPGYHQFHTTSSSYHGIPLHDDVGQYHQGGFRFSMAADPSSPIGSAALCGVPAINEEHSESSPEEGNQTSGRRVWTEEENLRLVSAWLNNSNDPIRGVDKKYDHYWKEVAKEYNKHSPKERRRTAAQLKTHWNRYAPVVSKFNSCWNRMKNAHASGASDDQIMERAHATFKSENSQKPFLFEYWWRVVKEQPKWGRLYPLENKRTKLNAFGAYTSSN